MYLFKRFVNSFNHLIVPVALFGILLLLFEQTTLMRGFPELIRQMNLSILGVFAADIVLNWIASRKGWRYLRSHWFDLIVFVPLIQFAFDPRDTAVSLVLRQAAIVAMLISRTRRIHKFISLLTLKPTHLMLISFVGAILFGAILLLLPAATAAGKHTDLVGALFTATSATCVTGLIVYDTATHFTFFGQAVILALIQVGGLGIMTFSMSLALLIRRGVSMKNQSVMRDVLDQDTIINMQRLVLFIFSMTFLLETAGAIALFFSWRQYFDSPGQAAWASVFHSVSAFCNAGFSTFSTSLVWFEHSLPVNAIIGGLIVLGGIGFVVIGDFYQAFRNKLKNRRGPKHKFRIQSRLALSWTGGLILAGTGLFYWIEHKHLLTGMKSDQALLVSLFQSVTTRTAGFNTCDIGALQPATLFLFIIFMFVGACPGGTAGGIKLTTPAVLWAVIRAGFNHREEPELYRRTVPIEVIQKAVMVLCSSLLLVCGATILLAVFEQKNFMDVLFETVSAFGTVGLSTGLTPELSLPGRILITLMMFIGRLGPLTIGFAFMLRAVRPAKYRYAEERIMIG
ncbi:MAG: TrkH family potassium uptake protein [Kiritimatiellales bacterium]